MQFKVTEAPQREEGEADVLLPGRLNSGQLCMSTDPGLGSGVWDPRAVCRLSTYASQSKARVKYQEQLKQIEGLVAMGARPGKCTL